MSDIRLLWEPGIGIQSHLQKKSYRRVSPSRRMKKPSGRRSNVLLRSVGKRNYSTSGIEGWPALPGLERHWMRDGILSCVGKREINSGQRVSLQLVILKPPITKRIMKGKPPGV